MEGWFFRGSTAAKCHSLLSLDGSCRAFFLFIFFLRRSHINSGRPLEHLLSSALDLLLTWNSESVSFDSCGHLDSPPVSQLTEVNERHSSASASCEPDRLCPLPSSKPRGETQIHFNLQFASVNSRLKISDVRAELFGAVRTLASVHWWCDEQNWRQNGNS